MQINQSMLFAILIDIQNDIEYMKRLLEKLSETEDNGDE